MLTDIMLKVPRDIASIVRTALEARAREFEAPLPTGFPPPNDTIEKAWISNARKLRALAEKLPRS